MKKGQEGMGGREGREGKIGEARIPPSLQCYFDHCVRVTSRGRSVCGYLLEDGLSSLLSLL